MPATTRRVDNGICIVHGMVQFSLEIIDFSGLPDPLQTFQVAVQCPDIVAMLQAPGQGIVDPKIVAIMLHRLFNVTLFQ